MKIYIGCSLTFASEEYKNNIDVLRKKLSKKYEVLEFLGLTKGTNTDVYLTDSNCVKSCDIIIAECSYPSLGLGYELGLGLEINKKVFAFAQEKAIVTRMILGINKPNFNFTRYQNFDELYELIINKIENF